MASLREQLESVYVQRGALTPTIVLEEARPVDSPLHSHFEWNDSEAAEQYRLQQAADLIRSVKITRVVSDAPVRMRAFLPTRGSSNAHYAPTDEVLADPVSSALVLREFERDWKALRARYGHLVAYREAILAEAAEAAEAVEQAS